MLAKRLSIIHSLFVYYNSLFSGLSESNLCRLERVQYHAAIIVTNSRGPVPCRTLLRQLLWLPIPNRIDFKLALLTLKVFTSQQPTYLNSLLHPYSAPRSLRSPELHLISIPRTTAAIQLAFSSIAPQFGIIYHNPSVISSFPNHFQLLILLLTYAIQSSTHISHISKLLSKNFSLTRL